MHYLIPALAVAASVLSTSSACADIGDQLLKLLPDDGAAEDSFGFSVAINRTTVIVGAKNDDDNDPLSGSAYLFNAATGFQIAKLLASDGALGDSFGSSVAICGTNAIVGAMLDDEIANNSGSAYLFDTTAGCQIAKLLPDDGATEDWFGSAVAISNTSAIVGAWRDDDNGDSSGSAYIFDITTGLQLAKILPDDGGVANRFGYSVAISDSIAIVGALGEIDNGTGSAYLFDISNPAKPTQLFKLQADDGATADLFGISVAINSDTAIVGAYLNDDNGNNSGSAYIFDISDPTNPRQLFKLLPDDGAAEDLFGISVAIDGITAIVGAHQDNDSGAFSGSAYLFDTGTGCQIAKLLPDDGTAVDLFGFSVSISGANTIIGASWDDDNGYNSGSAYIFDVDTSLAKCPWDLDKSGGVGTADLLELLSQWGAAGSADFDGDGSVGASDLLVLLANWGICA